MTFDVLIQRQLTGLNGERTQAPGNEERNEVRYGPVKSNCLVSVVMQRTNDRPTMEQNITIKINNYIITTRESVGVIFINHLLSVSLFTNYFISLYVFDMR